MRTGRHDVELLRRPLDTRTTRNGPQYSAKFHYTRFLKEVLYHTCMPFSLLIILPVEGINFAREHYLVSESRCLSGSSFSNSQLCSSSLSQIPWHYHSFVETLRLCSLCAANSKYHSVDYSQLLLKLTLLGMPSLLSMAQYCLCTPGLWMSDHQNLHS